MNGQVLSLEEIKLIHQDSLRILEEVGVKVPSEKALALLKEAGAMVDEDKKIAYISREMVASALASAPKKFTLGARNPEFNFLVPAIHSTLNMDGCGVNVIDFEGGQRRTAVLQDVANAGRIFDEISIGTVLWSCVTPSDVPAGKTGILSSATSLIHCSKHLQDEVQKMEEVPFVVELCKAILGSEQEMKDRKIYSATYCTVAPLCHDAEMLEATMELTKYGAPILVYPMPATGSTGPAGLYSNIALGNAESLSAFVIFQLTSPGTPLIYGAALGRINPKSGAFMEGAVETALMLAAMGQMGKYYGFPTTIAGCLSDANEVGMQSVLEKTMTAMPLVLNDIDVVQGMGLIGSSMTLSLEQMLIDEEIMNQCLRMRRGIDVGPEKNYFEDIKAVGQGGHFLKQKTTKTALRSEEFYQSKIIGSDSYDSWLEKGSIGMKEEAHKKVTEILNSEPKHPLEHNTEKVIREIMEEALAKL